MKINVERQDIKDWLHAIDAASRGERYRALWKRLYRLSAVPARSRHSVNIYKINKYTREGDNVVVPGKVLSDGKIDHKINISAIEFSAKALAALKGSGCTTPSISEMAKAERIKIII
jgi:large subunit ribosomal protein L18e